MTWPIDAGTTRSLGATGIDVTALGLGCAPLGNLFQPVTDADAAATIDAAWNAGVRLFDTAPLYGSGLSESRVGAGLAGRDDAVIASKVGRVLDDDLAPDPIFVDVPARGPRFDFTAEGIHDSLTASLGRLGVDRLDICWIHDPDDHAAVVVDESVPALRRMRDEGLVGAIGVGMNQSEIPARLAAAGLVDAVLIAGQCNLLDHHAVSTLFPTCVAGDVGVVVGGVFGSGLLADPWRDDVHYRYESAPDPVVDRARAIASRCEHHGVSVLAAAINFPFLHEAVDAVVVGARTPDEVVTNVAALGTAIPHALWEDLVSAGLLAPDALPA